MVAMAASTSFIRHLVFIVNIIVFEPFLIKGDVPFNQCGDPPPVPNTYRTFPDNVTVTYRCMDNFVLTSGNLTRVCEDGNYTGEAPVCEPITSNITWDHWVMDENQTLSDLASATECFVWNFGAMSPQEKDYSRKITRSEGHYHNFRNQMCKPGAVYNMTVFCWNLTSDGTYWTTGWIECVDCSKPPNVTNAKVIYNKTLIHSRAVYACLPGYEHIAGSDETTCLRTGDWEHPNMTCTRTSSPEHNSNKKCVKLGAQCYCRPVKQRFGTEDIKRLRLKITSLHCYKNKKISMPDERKMSQGIGFVAIAIITCTFGVFIVPDVISCLVNVKRFCRRLCK